MVCFHQERHSVIQLASLDLSLLLDQWRDVAMGKGALRDWFPCQAKYFWFHRGCVITLCDTCMGFLCAVFVYVCVCVVFCVLMVYICTLPFSSTACSTVVAC